MRRLKRLNSAHQPQSESPRPRRAPLIMALEPRIMFDAAAVATAETVATDHVDSHAESHPVAPPAIAMEHSQPVVPAAAPDNTAVANANVVANVVVFVDARVIDAPSLLHDVAPGAEIVYLQDGQDGLQQIADYLDQHQGVSSVQIIAHGNAGELWLGNTYLSADNVQAHGAVLAEIGQDLSVGGDILIYSCYTAEGERGLSFVDSLAQLTGRDVAASNDRTGIGGDWDLEIVTGSIESANVLSAKDMSDYQWGLATWTATNSANTGVGSLRAAIASAQNGDIVTFSSSMTVTLTAELLINKNITVDGDLNNDGAADVILDGQYRTRVVEVTSGSTVTLEGLVITRGLVSGTGGNGGYGATGAMGGGIFNAGILTLNNVSVTSNAASGGGGGGGVTGAFYGGGGGGGGGLGGQGGGHGGSAGPGTGTLGGGAGGGGVGGYGGGYDATHMGGRGGTSTGGAGGVGVSYYSNGGNGATATNGTISIGGGGGGAGWDKVGGAGGNAAGGIYNAASGTITVIGTSAITNNIGAGGGGGGGGGQGSNASNGGIGGRGVGAIWNKGTLLITAANFSAMSGNAAGSGAGGVALGGGTTGASPTAAATIYNDGGVLNTAYSPAPTATIVVADTSLSIGETSLVTITFSEAVTGFTNADLTIANGTLTAVSSSDGGITWTATFTPTASISDTTNVITLDNTGVINGLGTAGVGVTNSNNYTVDTVRPTAGIVFTDTALKVGETSLVTLTFNEAVTGLTNADLTIANGTLTSVSSGDGGITWTATFTPTASLTDASNLITLDNTGVSDLAGNAGSGTTDSNNYAIDTVRPTATIVVADTSLSIGETSLVTITFSEAVSGFTNADLTIANGTLTSVSSSDGGITWTATFTPSASIADTANLITLNNTGVSDLAGNAGSGTTDSNNYAIDTLRPTATLVVADNALKIGETSLVTITFSEAVTGFTNGDLTIANGTLTSVSSSDGGITWTATFTPTASLTDATNLITLDNTGVSDAVGNAGSGTTDSNNYAVDTVRPTATLVVADTALRIGETSLVTITFSEAVSGFTNADLTIANGTLTSVSSSDGGITWTATFTPSASIDDTTNLITLDNTGVSDLSGNAGSGTTDSNNYAIDTVRPTATIVLADTTLTAGETSLVTVTFSEAVSGFSNADLTIANGTLGTVTSSDGGITWTATFTPTVGVNDSSNVITLANTGVTDVAGNTGSGTTDSGNYTIDTVLPTATIVVADNALKTGETSLVTLTFSEAVSGFTNADLTVANGTLSNVSSGDGGVTWTATFTPTASVTDATNLISLDNSGVTNASGNAGVGVTDSNNYAIDTARPTATIVVADTALAIGETSLVTVTFSEAVTGFTNADLTIANGALSAVSSSDGGITWTATFTPTASITDATNLIALANTGVQDIAGNTGTGTTDSNNYAIDAVRPTATIVVADTALAAGETSTVTITFSEAVTGFTIADLTVANGIVSGLSSADGGITWTATLTPTTSITDTTNLITLDNTGVQDAAGNAGTGTTDSNNYAVDSLRPTATLVVADTALAAGESSTVTVTFNEAVSGLTTADFTVANGVLSGLSSADGGITWTATLTPDTSIEDTSNLVTLDNTGIQDAAGNTGSGTTDSNNYVIDTLRPTATLVVTDTALAAGENSTVTLTFNEAVTSLTTADFTVANGVLSGLSSADGGVTWTATLIPTAGIADTTNLITLDNTGVQDAAGNAGAGTTDSNNYAIDTARPTATIVVTDTALADDETSLVTLTFSEAITGFTNADLTIANGTLSAVSSSDGGLTWTASFTPTASITDTANIITLDNTAVQDAAGNAGTGTTDSNNYAIDTVRPTATIVVADATLVAGETSLVTIIFNEAVTGFSNADLTIANGTLTAVSTGDGGITWTATLTPTTGITDATNLITLDNTGVQDAAGNAGTGTTDSNNYGIDALRPTATITLADTALAAGETSLVTITFSEAVTGFTNADLTVANGTLSTVSSSDGGIAWTASLTPTAGITAATNLITLDNTGVQDAAGNTGIGTTDSNNYAIDTHSPTVTSVSVPANGSYVAGQNLDLTVSFDENIAVAGGAPRIALTLDGATVYADYVSGSGSNTLSFRYIVAPGDLDADGIALDVAVDANGSTLRDAAGNDAVLTLNGVPSTTAVRIDAVAPSVASVDVPASGTYIPGQNLDFVVNLGENVTVDTSGGTPRIAIALDTGGIQYANYVSGSGGSALTFRYTVASGVYDDSGITLGSAIELNGGTLQDAVGNATVLALNNPSSTSALYVDGIAPSVATVNVPADGVYTANQDLDFIVNFDQAVIVDTGAGAPRIALTLDTGGTVLANYVSGSGSDALTFRYTVADGDLDSNGVSVGAAIDSNGAILRDAAGNNAALALNGIGDTQAVTVDAILPSIVATSTPASGNYAAGQNLDFTLTYSEAVIVNTGGGTPYLALTLDNGQEVRADYLSGSGGNMLSFRYTVVAGDIDLDGIALASSITLNGGAIKDAANNDAAIGALGFNAAAIAIDGVAPEVASIVRVDTSPTNASSVDYLITFSENVDGLDVADFSLQATGTAAGDLASITPIDAGTYRVTLNNVTGDGTLRLDLRGAATGITDAAGNPLAGGFSAGESYGFDHTAPQVTSVAVPGDSGYTEGQRLDFTVTFDEVVTVDGGAPRIALVLDSGTTYASYVSGSGSNTLSFRYEIDRADQDVNGIALASSIDLNGGGIRDLTGNNGVLTLTGVGSTAGVKIGGVPPTILPPAETPEATPPPSIIVTEYSAPTAVFTRFANEVPASEPNLLTAQFTPALASLATGASTAPGSASAIVDTSMPSDNASGAGAFTSLSTPRAAADGFISLPSTRSEATSVLHAGTMIPPFTLPAGRSFEFTLPAGTFVSGTDAVVAVEARLANGQPLPAWLRFDPASGRFEGEPPAGWRQQLSIVVTARDQAGNEASVRVQLQFENERTPAAAIPGDAPFAWIQHSVQRQEIVMPTGKASLAEQFAQHGHQAWQRELTTLTQHARRAAQAREAMDEAV